MRTAGNPSAAIFRRIIAGLLMGCALLCPCGASAAAVSGYSPSQTFAPLTFESPVNRYRSASGVPGPDFWQNRADYEIRAQLDTGAKQLRAEEILTYTNQSPDRLASLWLQLDQNAYRRESRGVAANPERTREFTDGISFEEVSIQLQGRWQKADYLVDDTRMQIRLATPLAPGGGQTRIRMRYHYTIPGEFGGRTSWVATKNGEIYDIAQWYPRMAVYDDIRGWDTLPYLAQEFYLEYGNFDYYISVPSNMLVAGSGALQNPREVLTAEQQRRLAVARTSDSTVIIRGLAEPGPKGDGTLTWHYRLNNTRDVAFSASSAFIWDAARIQLPGDSVSLAMSFYPQESAGPAAWGRSTEYLKHAVEEFSRRWFVYPYPTAVNVAGGSSGMEYPALLFDGIEDKGKELFYITAHEIGQTWFPMVVGFDERRHAWMDEGFNTFIDVYESDAFGKGVYGPKRDSEFAPGGGNPVDEIIPILADPAAPVVMTRADLIPEQYRHAITYFKSALGLILLREQILGPERFDRAFRHFIAAWAFHHPQPADFFRAMESEGGEDLSWFWRGWYFNNWSLDLAIDRVTYGAGGPAHGALLMIRNLDRLIMPAIVEVEFEDGTRRRIRLPAETWILQSTAAVPIDSTQPVTTVTIDPDHVIPDEDRSNNVWGGKSR